MIDLFVLCVLATCCGQTAANMTDSYTAAWSLQIPLLTATLTAIALIFVRVVDVGGFV